MPTLLANHWRLQRTCALGGLKYAHVHIRRHFVIALVSWPKRIKCGAESHLRGGVRSDLCSIDHQCSSAPLMVQLSGNAHEHSDCTTKIAIVHWHLPTKTHHAGKVVSAAIIFCLLLAALLARFEQRGRQVSCALIRMTYRLAAYVIMAVFERGLRWMQTESVQVSTNSQ